MARSTSSKASSSTNMPCSAATSSSSSILGRVNMRRITKTPRSGGARFQDLVGIDQKILAHRRHAEGRQRGRSLAQMLEQSIETRGFGQNRHGRGPAACVGGDAAQPILALVAQPAGGRGTELEFRYDVEP